MGGRMSETAGQGAWALLRHRAACFLALSRTPHAVLDLAAPALTALLWLDRIPAWWIAVVGVVTTFAGYTSVYALNDLVDCGDDKRRHARGCPDPGDYLDSKMYRHPVALGVLSMRAGVIWAAVWGLIALAGAYILNPVCALILAGAFGLEVLYCRLACVSPLRVLVSGAVKTAGPVAAVFAVDASPAAAPLALLFAWLFLWEVGGQNIPADWYDVAEDRELGFRTLPARLSPLLAAGIAFASLAGAVALSLFLFRRVSTAGLILYPAGAVAAGFFLLLLPAGRLLRSRGKAQAQSLFNLASCYPAAMLGTVALKVLLAI